MLDSIQEQGACQQTMAQHRFFRNDATAGDSMLGKAETIHPDFTHIVF